MNKEQIITELKKLGIQSENCYPKTSFLFNSRAVIGLYEREIKDVFYFYNTYDEKIHSFKAEQGETHQQDPKTKKFLIPLEECPIVWENKPFEELPDLPYRDMSLRHYACIQLRVPHSGLPWLDNLIKDTSPL